MGGGDGGRQGQNVDVIDQRDRGRGEEQEECRERGSGLKRIGEEQRGDLGGGVANIGLHVQQGRDVNFHGESQARYRIPTAGSREAEGQKPVRGTCSPFPLNSSSLLRESPGLCSLQAPPCLSLPLCQTPGAIPTHSASRHLN